MPVSRTSDAPVHENAVFNSDDEKNETITPIQHSNLAPYAQDKAKHPYTSESQNRTQKAYSCEHMPDIIIDQISFVNARGITYKKSYDIDNPGSSDLEQYQKSSNINHDPRTSGANNILKYHGNVDSTHSMHIPTPIGTNTIQNYEQQTNMQKSIPKAQLSHYDDTVFCEQATQAPIEVVQLICENENTSSAKELEMVGRTPLYCKKTHYSCEYPVEPDHMTTKGSTCCRTNHFSIISPVKRNIYKLLVSFDRLSDIRFFFICLVFAVALALILGLIFSFRLK